MIRVVGIRFQQDGKTLYYNAGTLSPAVGDFVVAEASRGAELGEVVAGVREMEEDQVPSAMPAVIRIATPQDIQQATENRTREREAYVICQRKIAEHNLEMKLVSVESTFDNSKMLFYFTANGRVDFRALVKDLASTFRTRIELRQIGVRDEARMLGGLGPCGRPICCGSFLTSFQPVSIRMAKDQSLSLNPTKISGVCGRLMCCLKYEQEQYEQTRKRMPRVGKEVITPDGPGTVSDLNIVKETVSVRIPSGDATEIREYPLSQITRPGVPKAPDRPEEPETVPEEEIIPEEIPEDIPLEFSEEIISVISMEEEQLEKEELRRARRQKTERGPRGGSKPPRKKASAEGVERDGGKKQQGEGRGSGPAKKESRNKTNREQQFGQPVRRENPDRKNAPAAEKPTGIQPEPENAGQVQAAPAPGKPRAPRTRATGTAQGRNGEAPQARNPEPAKADAPKGAGQNPEKKPSAGNWAEAVNRALQSVES